MSTWLITGASSGPGRPRPNGSSLPAHRDAAANISSIGARG